jgi:hypothetical protein
VKCWGYNDNGELGNGTNTSSLTPVAVNGISTAIDVSASFDVDYYYVGHTCALLSDGTVKCWGVGSALGDGVEDHGDLWNKWGSDISANPVAVSGISTATSLSAGGYHTCAVLSDGTVKCWGSNDKGELGDGTTTYRPTPVTAVGVSTATQISAGCYRTTAVLSDGTIVDW